MDFMLDGDVQPRKPDWANAHLRAPPDAMPSNCILQILEAKMKTFPLILTLAATPAMADDTIAAEDFARSNILAIFYHEFGHALVDILDLPIYGREEDAADNASVLLMETLYDEATAAQMVIDTADAFWAESWEQADDLPVWGVHGLSEQRYYNTICIFFGGDPDGRGDMIDLMGLPEDRAETCEEEYAAVDHSWGTVLRGLAHQGGDAPGLRLEVRSDEAPLAASLLAAEIAVINAAFELPQDVPVLVETCGEANAYYFPDTQSITVCVEFEAYLFELYSLLDQ
jgi:hypothetical protein